MLSYLLANNYLEAALRISSPTQKTSFEAQLLTSFGRGDRTRFLQVFGLLGRNSKLQFYLQVYFLIYQIHPSLGRGQHIPKDDMRDFKDYIDTRGSELAKTNEFLEFYALPYIKQPLQHPTFKSLFKKEWVDNLKQKLRAFLKQETKRVTQEADLFQGRGLKQQVKKEESQSKADLFLQLDQYIEKYNQLQSEYKSVIAITNTNMMESQNKWFQIVKQLVQCSRSLITLISKHNKELTSERRFLNIRKKIDRFERFVSHQLQDMISQSQDISVFDRPSINEISCTIAATHKSYSNNLPDLNPLVLQEYIPTSFRRISEALGKHSTEAAKQRNVQIIKGLTFRILKSKDPFVRRQNIIGILESDVLGTKQNHGKNHLFSYMKEHVLLLLTYIESDYLGRNVLFTLLLVRDLVRISKKERDSEQAFGHIVSMLQHLSVRENIKVQLINSDVIHFYLGILKDQLETLSDNVVEKLSATLLNLTSRPEGLDKFEKESDVFYTLGGLLESQNPIVRVITNGTVYSLLGRKKLYDNAFQVGLNEIVSYLIENDPKANIKELKFIQDRLIAFQPSNIPVRSALESDDADDIFDEDFQIEYEDDITDFGEYLRAHEMLVNQFGLTGREAVQQSTHTRNVLDVSLKRLRQNNNVTQIKSKNQKMEPLRIADGGIQKQRAVMIDSYMSPRNRTEIQSQQVMQNNQSLYIAQFASVVVEPTSNFSPEYRVKPRQHIIQKLNNQIKASRRGWQAKKQQSEQKQNHFSFNQNQQSAVQSQKSARQPKVYEDTEEYKTTFAPKPKLGRSPPSSPREC